MEGGALDLTTEQPATRVGCMTTLALLMSAAACRKADPDLFFTEDPLKIAAALSLCSQCPVVEECGAWAKSNGEKAGIWGGKNLGASVLTIEHGKYTGYVRGCHLTDCAPLDGCLGAKRRYAKGQRDKKRAAAK